MATALDLIERSLRLVGILAAGETLPAEDAEDALAVLNDMLDAWRLESLLAYTINRQVFPIQAGVQVYTIGVGGMWNIERPVRIESAFFQNVDSQPPLELPMLNLTQDQYESLRVKGISSTWPQAFYYTQDFPLGQVLLYPKPSLPNNIVLYLWGVLSQIPSVSTVVTWPPGYARALQYNLALELAPEYGKELSATAQGLARESKARIKDINAETPVQYLDSALIAGPGATFNIYSDDYNWRP